MKYSDIKNILYRSEEIRKIPDKWVESVPFRCIIKEEEYDAFLYWNTQKTKIVLKRLIGIKRTDGEIVVLNDTELLDVFDLSSLEFSQPIIEDYDTFFHNKERYELLYDQLCNSDSAFKEVGEEEYELWKQIVGSDLMSNLFSNLAGNYIAKLHNKI